MLDKLVLYIPIHYPNEKEFFEILDVLSEEGVQYLELGVPVKNPIMDGPLIKKAHQEILKQGFNTNKLTKTLEIIRKKYAFKIILMTYIEGVEKYYLNNLSQELYDGILCVDEILEKSDNSKALQVYPPNLNEDRINFLLKNNILFAYVISGEGKTGTFSSLPNQYVETIENIRKTSTLPAFVGFGIKTAEDVKNVLQNGADGAIIGTEFMRSFNEDKIDGVKRFLNQFKIYLN